MVTLPKHHFLHRAQSASLLLSMGALRPLLLVLLLLRPAPAFPLGALAPALRLLPALLLAAAAPPPPAPPSGAISVFWTVPPAVFTLPSPPSASLATSYNPPPAPAPVAPAASGEAQGVAGVICSGGGNCEDRAMSGSTAAPVSSRFGSGTTRYTIRLNTRDGTHISAKTSRQPIIGPSKPETKVPNATPAAVPVPTSEPTSYRFSGGKMSPNRL